MDENVERLKSNLEKAKEKLARKPKHFKKIKDQHFLQEVENPLVSRLEYDTYDLTEVLFDDGSVELWIILEDNYEKNEHGDFIIKSTVFYKGWDTIGVYYYKDGHIEYIKIRW